MILQNIKGRRTFMRKTAKALLFIVMALVLMSVVAFLPTFQLKTSKMITKETDNFVFIMKSKMKMLFKIWQIS